MLCVGGIQQTADKRQKKRPARPRPVYSADCAKMTEQSPKSALSIAELLETVGCDWVKSLLAKLRAKGRVALFSSSKQLARVVVRNACRTKLHLHEIRRRKDPYEPDWQRQQDEVKIFKRRYPCIKTLLTGCHDLELTLNTSQQQPFPNSFCSSITTLVRHQDDNSRSVTAKWDVYMFKNMSNLQVLSLGNRTTTEDVNMLCEALKAGQLPCLHSLALMTSNFWGTAELKRLAAKAGSQIIHLKTTCVKLLCEVSKFTKLQTLGAYDTYELSEAVPHMCGHPTV